MKWLIIALVSSVVLNSVLYFKLSNVSIELEASNATKRVTENESISDLQNSHDSIVDDKFSKLYGAIESDEPSCQGYSGYQPFAEDTDPSHTGDWFLCKNPCFTYGVE